jgi:hypothetical protein
MFKTRVSTKYMLLAFVHMSSNSKFIFDCVLFSLRKCLSLSRHRLCTQKRSLLGGYQGHNALMPSTFFQHFSKNFRQLCRDQLHKREVF